VISCYETSSFEFGWERTDQFEEDSFPDGKRGKRRGETQTFALQRFIVLRGKRATAARYDFQEHCTIQSSVHKHTDN